MENQIVQGHEQNEKIDGNWDVVMQETEPKKLYDKIFDQKVKLQKKTKKMFIQHLFVFFIGANSVTIWVKYQNINTLRK